MRTVIVIGGGPAGLYFSILLRLAQPGAAVRVVERNTATHETFGFGVAFHEATLRKLADADPVSRDSLGRLLRPWDEVAFHVRDVEHRVSGHAFAGCSRHSLIDMLQRRAAGLGVVLEYETNAVVTDFPDADLVVVADGSGSHNRALLADTLQPQISPRPNRFVWLGTDRKMAEMNFFFREAFGGVFVAHAYPHDSTYGTWIAETDESTFHNAGLDGADEVTTVERLQGVFAEDLAGARLIARDSFWRQFPMIRSEQWVAGNVVLLGDAKATVHYSLGSGTKIAMEDALALVRALSEGESTQAALGRYEQVRRPEVELLQRRALGSMHWFESMREHWRMQPAQFIFSGVTRKADETYHSVRARGPALANGAITHYLGTFSTDTSPFDVPCSLARIPMPGRRAVQVGGSRGARLADRGRVDLAMSPPVAKPADLARTLDLLRKTPAAARAVVSAVRGDDLPDLAQQVACAGVDMLVVDLSELPALDGTAAPQATSDARRLVSAARAAWPENHPLGLRLRPPRDPVPALAPINDLVAQGCSVLVVAGARSDTAGTAFMTDYFGLRLDVTTVCDDLATDDLAATALLSGRADFVVARDPVSVDGVPL